MHPKKLQADFNIDNNKKCFLGSKPTYVTLDHKTSHKGQFFLHWDLYITWKSNK